MPAAKPPGPKRNIRRGSQPGVATLVRAARGTASSGGGAKPAGSHNAATTATSSSPLGATAGKPQRHTPGLRFAGELISSSCDGTWGAQWEAEGSDQGQGALGSSSSGSGGDHGSSGSRHGSSGRLALTPELRSLVDDSAGPSLAQSVIQVRRQQVQIQMQMQIADHRLQQCKYQSAGGYAGSSSTCLAATHLSP